MSFIYTVFFTAFWLAPSVIAIIRGHKNLIPIILVNLFLSFTIIGYIISLVWSFSNNIKHEERTKDDWKIFIIFLAFAFVCGFLFVKSIDDYSKDVVEFVKVYTFIPVQSK
jgi:hypothetical protein